MPALNGRASHAQVQKNGTATFLARIVGAGGAAIQQADVASIGYTVYLLDETDANAETAVVGHTAVAVAPISSYVFNTLQTADARWDAARHGGGYNFLYTIAIAAAQAFALRGRRYLVRFSFTPTTGQVYHVDFIMAVQ